MTDGCGAPAGGVSAPAVAGSQAVVEWQSAQVVGKRSRWIGVWTVSYAVLWHE